MSLFSVLNVANRGLTASQMGLDVTGQNIANASTDGYSRKRLTLSAEYAYNGTFGQTGFGVNIENIARLRDSSIDQQIQRQNFQFGYFNEMDKSLEAIENILNEPSDNGIITFMDEFFDSWSNLANNPEDSAARTMVKTAGQTLTDVFNNIALELQNHRISRNQEMVSVVNEINKIGAEVYNLNNEIATVELSGQNANDSRDRRDFLMKNLSEMVDFETIEADDGQITVTIGGNIFVSSVSFNALELHADGTTQTDDSGYVQYGIKMEGNRHDLKVNGGALKGIMDARDVNVPKFEEMLDELAVELVNRVNEQHSQGYNLNGYTGFDFFDSTTTGARDIKVASAITTDINNLAAASGGSQTIGVSNITAVGEMDFGNPAIKLSETLGRPWLPTDSTDEAVKNIINGSLTVKDAVSGNPLSEGIDYNVNYVTGEVQLLHTGHNGKQFEIDFSYTVGNFSGPGNNGNAIEMSAMREKLSMVTDHKGDYTTTFGDYYSGVIGELGLDRNEAISNKDTREYLIEQYMDSQEAVAGVSLDEEMSNLIKFQHTYQAAAKIVATTNQMLDILMNL